MGGVTASPTREYALRGKGWTFYDFSTGGGLTLSSVSLTPATGQVATQNSSGVRMQWSAATSGQQVGIKWQPASALNWQDTETFGFEFDFSSDITCASLGGVRVIFSNVTGTGYTQYWTKLANTGAAKFGRRIMWLNKSDFGVGAGTPNWNSIARIEIFWQKSTRTTTVVPLDITLKGFYVSNRHQTPVLIWTFDDDDATQYTEVYAGTTNPTSCMSVYGWPGTCYVNSNSVGTTNKMTIAQMTTLQNAGWDICSHTHSHIANTWQYTPTIVGTTVTLNNAASIAHGKSPGDLVTVTKMDPTEMTGTYSIATTADNYTMTYVCPTPEATTSLVGYNVFDYIPTSTLQSNIQTCVDYLWNNGFTRALKHYSYPYGYHSDAVVTLLQSMGFLTARTLSTMTGSTQAYGWTGLGIAPGSLDWYRIPARGMSNTDTAAGILADIDTTIKYGGAIVLYGHNFTATPSTSRDFSLSELKLLFDGVKSREREGKIQIMTMRQYYESCIADGV